MYYRKSHGVKICISKSVYVHIDLQLAIAYLLLNPVRAVIATNIKEYIWLVKIQGVF